MPSRKVPTQPAGWREIGPHALLSLGAFVGGLVLVVILLGNGRTPEGQLFYLILLPLGMIDQGRPGAHCCAGTYIGLSVI